MHSSGLSSGSCESLPSRQIDKSSRLTSRRFQRAHLSRFTPDFRLITTTITSRVPPPAAPCEPFVPHRAAAFAPVVVNQLRSLRDSRCDADHFGEIL